MLLFSFSISTGYRYVILIQYNPRYLTHQHQISHNLRNQKINGSKKKTLTHTIPEKREPTYIIDKATCEEAAAELSLSDTKKIQVVSNVRSTKIHPGGFNTTSC